MNNGKYFSIMDLARGDLMNRAGLARKIAAHGLYPVVVGQTIRFRKSILLWQAFDIESCVLGWDDKAFLVGQRFIRNGTCLAEAVVRARFLKRAGGSIEPKLVLDLAGVHGPSPALPVWIRDWNAQQSQ